MARDMSGSERAAKAAKKRHDSEKTIKVVGDFPKCLGLYPDSECLGALPWKPGTDCCYEELRKETDDEGNVLFDEFGKPITYLYRKKKCPYFVQEGVKPIPSNPLIFLTEIRKIKNENEKKRYEKGNWR